MAKKVAIKANKSSLEIELISSEESTPTLRGKVEKTRTRRRSYTLDLRIHSPASLGYFHINGLDTAPALVRLAKVKGLDVIAITDFFSSAFVDKMIEAAKDSSLTVIPGVNLRCQIGDCKDVVLTCLFPEHYRSEEINAFLKALNVPASAFGNKDYVLVRSFKEILKTIEDFNGAAFPSRMDKTPQQMHVIPMLVEDYGFRAFDLAYADSVFFFKQRWPKIKFRFLSFSNARALAQIGSRMIRVKLENPGFQGVKELVGRE